MRARKSTPLLKRSGIFYLFSMLFLILAACNAADDPAPKTDVTLEPSQIAANIRVTFTASPAPTEPPTREPTEELTAEATENLSEATQEATEEIIESAIQPTVTLAPTHTAIPETPTETPIPQATPTSNSAEIKALQDNSDLFVTLRFEAECGVAGEFIPFTLEVINVSNGALYFYKNGLWMLSINNSPVGPRLAIQEPQLRSDFVELAPNTTFVQEEDDLGLWVQSLGPESGIAFSPTGLGLPAGDYWVTFVYTNDKDGLTEQPDGTFLIDRAAWRGTTVSSEKRLRVVENLSECSEG